MEAVCIVRANKGGLEYSEENQTHWKHKWDKQTVTYALQQDSEDIVGRSIERRCVNIAMSTWNFEIPLRLKSVRGDKNPDIFINFVHSKDDKFLEKGTLAYAYYPKTSHAGKIVFNEDYLWTTDGKPVNAHEVNPQHYPLGTKTKLKSYNMVHVLIHEIGHCLGLTHDAKNSQSVMWWQYNGQLHLNPYDIERITQKYGARKWRRSGLYRRLKRWLRRRVERI